MSERYVTYKLWDGCTAPNNLESNGRLLGHRVLSAPDPCDRDALLALADKMDRRNSWFSAADAVHAGSFADRIREALGVE